MIIYIYIFINTRINTCFRGTIIFIMLYIFKIIWIIFCFFYFFCFLCSWRNISIISSAIICFIITYIIYLRNIFFWLIDWISFLFINICEISFNFFFRLVNNYVIFGVIIILIFYWVNGIFIISLVCVFIIFIRLINVFIIFSFFLVLINFKFIFIWVFI